jgi:glucosamine-6-phosphate deaminase
MNSSPKPIQQFKAEKLPVRIYSNGADLASDAAAEVDDYLQKIIQEQSAAAVILATGNSQIEFLRKLIALDGVDWSKVILFHMDEYLGISADHPASFRRYMREKVEALVKPRAFHYLEGDALLPMDECDRYARLLRAQSIDLCCLGVGENGHLAFNDPPVADFADPRDVKIVQLDLACRRQQSNEGHFPSLEAVPQYALTLTIPMLCAARKMLCIAPEKRKARAIQAALRKPISTDCPASFLRQQPHATLLLDTDSASLL